MKLVPRPSVGRGPAATAVLLAAALTTAGAAGLAQAAEEAPIPVTITGTERVDLAVDGAEVEPGQPQVSLHLEGPGEVDEDAVTPTAIHDGPYKVTIDATELKGFAKVELPCPVQDDNAFVAVCERNLLYPADMGNPYWNVRLDLLDTAKAGDAGRIKVTGEGEGLSFGRHAVDVLVDGATPVGGPALQVKKLPRAPKNFAAGDTYAAPLGFRNAGEASADGVLLRFTGTRGITYPQTYSNCTYAEENTASASALRKVVECSFEGEFKAGTAYAVEKPVQVGTEKFARYETFAYEFSAAGEQGAGARIAGGTKGTGSELKLKEVSGDSGYTTGGGTQIDLAAGSKFDLDLSGVKVSGKQGETVKADVTLANHGPAWFRTVFAGGDEPMSFDVAIPKGASVVTSPEECEPQETEKGVDESRYRCFTPTPILENSKRSFAFELRIDEVVEGAMGKVTFGYETANPDEANPANDDGWIVLNGTGDEETPGDTGGASGGNGDNGDNGGSGDGQDGDGSGDGENGGTDSGGSQGGTTGGGDADTEGGLASTGSIALMTSAVAAAAIAAGGAFFVIARRRKATS
ncbi:hypothetical protein [Streptomyces sp. KLOTTS4A1]|uniref:hypothetical protein n=1 Tax=Streptomyces sp. KLOTTS4A1 TaxID=3390996 RepID=UPI0039F4F1BF